MTTDLEAQPVGTMVSEIGTPGMVRILRKAGFNFAVVDCEHGPFTFPDITAMAAVATEASFRLLVRVPAVTREHIGRVLDGGADGIVVPMVDDAETAREAVRFAKYQPTGDRGVSVTRAHSGYGVDNLSAYLESANDRVQVWVQIETREALERVDEIAATPGLTGLIVGPNDFLQAIGATGDLEHPELAEAIQRVASAAERAALRSGIISSNARLLQYSAACGMTFLVMDSELGHLLRGGKTALKSLRAG